ncbi:hypothetical protein EV356DRAFT_3179 [Viridothelium virens]|uniref:Uncharacterized protein n=1 Tax=Viridothelium virens TaxID=1048519 RepID=A0A6A6HQT6_VIRVR|nr:hypothetical protein EV356DRAFT_3179 [Viridothelium virens]
MASKETDSKAPDVIVAEKACLDTLNSSFTPSSSNDAEPHGSASSNSSNIIDSLISTSPDISQYHFLTNKTSSNFPHESGDPDTPVDGDSNEPDRYDLTEEQKRYFDPVDEIIGRAESETHMKITPLHNFEELELENSLQLKNHNRTNAVFITPSDELDESDGKPSITVNKTDSSHWQDCDTKHFPNQQANHHLTYLPEYAGHYHSANSTANLDYMSSANPFVSNYGERSARLYTDNAEPESSDVHPSRVGDLVPAVLLDYGNSYPRYHWSGSLSGPHPQNGSTGDANSEMSMYYSKANGMPHVDYGNNNYAAFEDTTTGEPTSTMLTNYFRPNTGSYAHGSSPINDLTHHGYDQFRSQGSQLIPYDNAFNHGEVKEDPNSYSQHPNAVYSRPRSIPAAHSAGDTILHGTRLDRMHSFMGFHKDSDAAYDYMSKIRRNYEVAGYDDWQRVEADPIPFVRGIYEAMSTLKPEADSSQVSYWSTMTRKGHEQQMIEARAWDIVQTAINQHKHGITNFPELEIHKRDPLDNSMCCSERLGRIQDILYGDKLVCKDVVDGNKVTYLVATPNAWINRKNDNRRLNKDKGAIMRAGKRTVTQFQNAQVMREATAGLDYHVIGVENVVEGRDLSHGPALPSEAMEQHVESRAKNRPKSRRPPKRAKKNDDDEEWAPRQSKGKKRDRGVEDE